MTAVVLTGSGMTCLTEQKTEKLCLIGAIPLIIAIGSGGLLNDVSVPIGGCVNDGARGRGGTRAN